MPSDAIFALEGASANQADWRAAVDRVLGATPFDRLLVSETHGGLDIQPLYKPGPVGQSAVPTNPDRADNGWDVRQQHQVRDLDACRAAVLEDLEHGVTSIELQRPDAPWTLDQLRHALADVLVDLAPVALAPHADPGSAAALLALLSERGDESTSASWLGLDPIGEVARTGRCGDLKAAASTVAEAHDLGPNLVGLTVDTTVYVEAGATEIHELAWGLATGVAYLRALEDAGLPLATAAKCLGFRVSADADQFVTLARLRATRVAWAHVLTSCGVAAPDQQHHLHAVTNRTMFSVHDQWVNMLRSTSAVLGAGAGGADAITVLPVNESGTALVRRAARNTQLLLIEESGIGRLTDPGAGSAYIESLTERIVHEAWLAFQEIEGQGGISAALATGTIRAAVDTAWEARLDNLATRREAITGVSEFPELPPVGYSPEPQRVRPVGRQGSGFPLRRLAATFEELRDAADRGRLAGRDPVVHIAALGSHADHNRRSTWVMNLLAVGGVRGGLRDGDGAPTPSEAAATFAATAATAVVVCSSDEIYAERAVATVAALKQSGARFIAIAGDLIELRDELAAAGVDAFWAPGVDVIAALKVLHAVLELR